MKRTTTMCLLLSVCLAGLNMGCFARTKHKGEWRLELTNGIAFHSLATKSEETTVAEAGFEASDWIKGGILSLLFGNGEEETATDGG